MVEEVCNSPSLDDLREATYIWPAVKAGKGGGGGGEAVGVATDGRTSRSACRRAQIFMKQCQRPPILYLPEQQIYK